MKMLVFRKVRSMHLGRLSNPLPGGVMNRTTLATSVALSLGLLLQAAPLSAQSGVFSVGDVAIQRPAADAIVDGYTARQLDNLVAPVALYPDALLAQVLIASTFPDQVEDAAIFVRENGTAFIDDQEWDISVRSVAHYPSALNMMADRSDWMATLGRAYAFQSSDVMAAVQRMRSMAAQHGNLVSTNEQQVVHEEGNYAIVPAQPRVIYVPVYDPVVIYTRPIFSMGVHTRYWSFGVGFPIGSWLAYDLDWRVRRVYYNGWSDQYVAWGGGWRVRSRPFIQITNIYVNPRYQTVYVNRNVVRRHINYRNVDRHSRVHRDTWFGDRSNGSRDSRYVARTAQPRERPAAATPEGYRRGGENRVGNTRGGGGGGGGGGDGANQQGVRNPRGNENGNRPSVRNPRGSENGTGPAVRNPRRGTENGGQPSVRNPRGGTDNGNRSASVPPRTGERSTVSGGQRAVSRREQPSRATPPAQPQRGTRDRSESARPASRSSSAQSSSSSARQAPQRGGDRQRAGAAQRGAQRTAVSRSSGTP